MGRAYLLVLLACFQCGDFRNVSNDVVVLEAFLHAVEHLRQTTGVDFGAVAFDDCYSSLHITSVLSDFLSGLEPFDKVGSFRHIAPVKLLLSDCPCQTGPDVIFCG